MNLETRIKKLEKRSGVNDEEFIVRLIDYSDKCTYPSEEEQIASARARGEKFITVNVRYRKIEHEDIHKDEDISH